jgi:class 3 adenylate cyclase
MADLPVPENQRPPPREGNALSERVADVDRDRTVTALREHVVEGRLTLDEFSERVGLALEAKTRGDLDHVMADLPTPAIKEPSIPARKPRRWHVAVMSGHSTKGRWRISGKTNVVAVMGGADMDLRGAEIEGSEVEITAVAFWGGVKIIVPEGFDVELQGFSFMGGRTMRLRDVPRVPGSPRIVVRAFSCMAGIEIRSRPNRSGREIAQASSEGVLGVADGPTDGSVPSPSPGELASVGADFGTDGTVTILFCDMVDYAGMTERLGDQASRRILREHHRMVRDALARHGGREISVQGDGFMVAFGGVARALRCAVDIQRAFDAFGPAEGGEPIAVHIGIHTGDAVDEGDDYLGHTVIVASRLADAAGPGEILVSSLSEQLVQGSGEFAFDGHRESQLKGLARPQPSAKLSWAE